MDIGSWVLIIFIGFATGTSTEKIIKVEEIKSYAICIQIGKAVRDVMKPKGSYICFSKEYGIVYPPAS